MFDHLSLRPFEDVDAVVSAGPAAGHALLRPQLPSPSSTWRIDVSDNAINNIKD